MHTWWNLLHYFRFMRFQFVYVTNEVHAISVCLRHKLNSLSVSLSLFQSLALSLSFSLSLSVSCSLSLSLWFKQFQFVTHTFIFCTKELANWCMQMLKYFSKVFQCIKQGGGGVVHTWCNLPFYFWFMRFQFVYVTNEFMPFQFVYVTNEFSLRLSLSLSLSVSLFQSLALSLI